MPEVLTEAGERFKEDLMERKPDGYWLQMGKLAVEALSAALREDLTPRRREIIAEYLGGIMDNAYYMGIRTGEMSAKLQQRELESSQQQIKK